MSVEKRKAVVSDKPVKRIKFDDSGKPKVVSVVKPAKPTTTAKAKPEENGEVRRNTTRSSLLSGEDRAFPRGGASVLTPLEKRQIRADAERDVLFEEAGKQKPQTDEYDDLGDAEGNDGAPRKKRRKSAKAEKTHDSNDSEHVKIQGLGYKTIAVGSLVLGQVAAITSKDIALALPNNLTGYVPLTSVSDALNERLQRLLDDAPRDDAAKDGDDRAQGDDSDDVELKDLFRVGQYLRACVTATTKDAPRAGSKSKRHIELTVNPQQANTGLRANELEDNYMVQVSVRSVEDHGVVVDLGLKDESVRGFISKKELGQRWKLEDLQQGQVLLCCVTGSASAGKVIKLCPDPLRISDTAKRALSKASTIDPFLPGTAAEILVSDVTETGIAGKIMGAIVATADAIHSGLGTNADAFSKIKIGQKTVGRVLFQFIEKDVKKVGVSLLEHMRKFEEQPKAQKTRRYEDSKIIEAVKVTKIIPGVGVFFDVGLPAQSGFAHISKLSDDKVDALFEETGPFALGTSHRARVLSYNLIDGVYNLSLEQSVLDKKYLRLEDVAVGSTIEGKVEKLVLGDKGVNGVVVDLGDGMDGMIESLHMADVHLSNPEKRFRPGVPVKARVLYINMDTRRIRLTAKKSLLNSDLPLWKAYENIKEGDQSIGTITKLQRAGAVVHFYGRVRAWLPVGEMSEAFVSDASKHFRVGQTIMVRAKEVEATEQNMIVTCRDAQLAPAEAEAEPLVLTPGEIVRVKVTEIAADLITVEAEPQQAKGTIAIGQLSDGTEERNQKLAKQYRIGQTLSEVLVLSHRRDGRSYIMSGKRSLIDQAGQGLLPAKFDEIKVDNELQGFVRHVTADAAYVEFLDGLVGLLPKGQVEKARVALPALGYKKDASVTARVLAVDETQQRFVLTQRAKRADTTASPAKEVRTQTNLENPVDGVSQSIDDFTLGKETKARITSIKDTQLNVQLADNLQGRIDVSEAFDDWKDIKDHKRPLRQFKPKQVLPVKILGIHDARNHRFLPITHRQSKDPIFELTTKINAETDSLTLGKLEAGSSHIAFVNNISDSCVWVNITPAVRGRIDLMDLTDDASKLQNLPKNFPVGSALKVIVKRVDVSANKLDLAVAGAKSSAPSTFQDVSLGAVLPGKVIQVTERSVRVALSDDVTGVIGLTDITDDYSEASTSTFRRNDIVRVSVVDVDVPNKRLFLSTRPSKILSSALKVADAQVTSLAQLKPTDVVRGFIKLVRQNGVIVSLGPRVEAFVRVSDLSDAYIKDWQSEFQIDQLVKGKILAVDVALNHVQMSLKASHVDKDYTPPRKLEDLAEGEVVTGKVRKVEDFGVFIDADDTQPRVSGLCHRSEIADRKVGDVKAVYEEGDAVKAKILSIDLEKRRISFGLKASYFANEVDESEAESEDNADEAADVTLDQDTRSDQMSVDGGVDSFASRQAIDHAVDSEDDDDEEVLDADQMDVDAVTAPQKGGLKVSGFNWDGGLNDVNGNGKDSDEDALPVPKKRKSRTEDAPFVDRTGDLDTNGPQSSADFERLLLSVPHDSSLWVSYMVFHLRLSEVDAARAIGYRALQTIPLRETDEKMQIWIALLNLEVAYSAPPSDSAGTSDGQDAAVESVLKQASAVQDAYEVHTHLAAIYIAAGQYTKADRLYESMLSSEVIGVPTATNDKMRKDFRARSQLWLTYANFLFQHLPNEATRARGLLSRALKSVPEREVRELTVKFAGMEFKWLSGDPERARTVLEGVVGEWGRWSGGWDAWVEGEMILLRRAEKGEDAGVSQAVDGKRKRGKQVEPAKKEDVKDQVERIRKLFERMTKGKMKSRRAKNIFKKWREFEEKYGVDRDVERVVALASEWVENAKRAMEEAEEED